MSHPATQPRRGADTRYASGSRVPVPAPGRGQCTSNSRAGAGQIDAGPGAADARAIDLVTEFIVLEQARNK